MYEIPEERDKAAGEWEQIANSGDSYAQYIMGLLYRDGGLLVPDAEQAKGWLELSAQELPDAQYAKSLQCLRKKKFAMSHTIKRAAPVRRMGTYTPIGLLRSGCAGSIAMQGADVEAHKKTQKLARLRPHRQAVRSHSPQFLRPLQVYALLPQIARPRSPRTLHPPPFSGIIQKNTAMRRIALYKGRAS